MYVCLILTFHWFMYYHNAWQSDKLVYFFKSAENNSSPQ